MVSRSGSGHRWPPTQRTTAVPRGAVAPRHESRPAHLLRRQACRANRSIESKMSRMRVYTWAGVNFQGPKKWQRDWQFEVRMLRFDMQFAFILDSKNLWGGAQEEHASPAQDTAPSTCWPACAAFVETRLSALALRCQPTAVAGTHV